MAATASSRERSSIPSATSRQAAALATLLLLLVSSMALVPGARAGDPRDGDGDGDVGNPCVPFIRNDNDNVCFNPLTFSPTDCDRDGDSNVEEILAGDEPCGPESTLQDSDGDGWQDRVESLANLENQELSNRNSAQSTPFTDDDADGCVNLLEWAAGTSRNDPADRPQEQACGGPAFQRPGVSITSVDGALPTVRPDGTLLVTGHKDRAVTIVGTSSPGRLLDQDRAVTAVLLNYNDRAADTRCDTVATTPPTTVCNDPPRSYNGNENTRANVLGGRYWKIVNATGPASAPFATWSITLDLQGTDIPRDDGAYEIPITVIGYDGPFNRGYVPGTEATADGSCGVQNGATCVGKRDTRVPLVPLEGSPEWSDPVQLALQFVQDHIPVVNLVGNGGQGPTKKVTNTITASYEDSDDKAERAYVLVCKAKTGTCDDKATDPAPKWFGCDSSDGVWDTNVSLECDWTPTVDQQPPFKTYYVRVAVVDERGYNTTVENGAYSFTKVVARIANEVAINGNLTDRDVHDELVALSGRIVDHDGTGNTLKHVQVNVKDKILVSGQLTTPKVDEIVVNPADITDCTPSGGARAYCWTALWNVSTYASPYNEANDLRLDVSGTDSEGFPLESDLSNAVKDVTLHRNTPPVVTFGTLELDNGTVYAYNATTGNWATNGTDVGPNPDVYGAFNVTLVVEDVDNVRPAWSPSRLDEVKVSLGKGEAPFIVTTPATSREQTSFEELGLEEIHVPNKRMCQEYNAVTVQAGEDMCTYAHTKNQNGKRVCPPSITAATARDWVKCNLDINPNTSNSGSVDVTLVPGYILTSRGTIVLGADTALLSAGFVQCVEDRAAEVRDMAEGGTTPPATCEVDENSVDESDTDGNVDVQFGADTMQVLCETVYSRPPPPDDPAAPTNQPTTCGASTSTVTDVVHNWLVGVTLNEGEVLVGVSTVCQKGTAAASSWCSTAVRNTPGDELDVNDYGMGDNDGEKDGDEYDQVDRSFSRTTTACFQSQPFPSNNVPADGSVLKKGQIYDGSPVCPLQSSGVIDGDGISPVYENGAPDCGGLEPVPGVLDDPCVIPFGQLADDLGINGIQLPVTVDGVTLMGYLVTPEDYSELLGNAVCLFGTSANREPPNPSHYNCGSSKDQPGKDPGAVGTGFLVGRQGNYSAGYLDHRNPAAIIGGEAGLEVGPFFGNLRDPSTAQSPKWAIPRGFNFQPANNTTGLDAKVTSWVASVNATGNAKSDGVRNLFAAAFDGVEDFATTPACVPAECTPSVAPFVNNGRDRDRDGYKDADERAAGSDPFDGDSVPADQDEDFVPDAVDDDRDGDGVDNDDEESGYAIQYPPQRAGQVKQTNASESDTDGDGYSDGSEREHLTDPTDATVHPDDLDGDGYFNDDEDLNRELFGTNDRANSARTPADSDGDGFYDWEELLAGTDPFNASDKPAAGNAFYDLDADRDRVPDALEPTLCAADRNACFGGNYVPRVDVDRQVFEPAFRTAYTAAGCPALFAGGALADAVGGTLPSGDAATAAAIRCVTLATGRLSATFGVFDPQVRPNAFNSFTVYNDVDHDERVDAGEELATTPPANPKVRPNPDGSRTVYNDRNGDGTPGVGEEQVTTAGANPKTQTNPDGTTTVYNDKNNNNQTDAGEESATVTPNPCPANTCPLPASSGANNLVVRLRVLTPGNPSADPDGVAVGKASSDGQFSFEVSLWNARCEAVPFTSLELRYRIVGNGAGAAELTLGTRTNADGDNVVLVTTPTSSFDTLLSQTANRVVLMRGLFNGGSAVNGWVSPSAAKLQLAGACALADVLDSQPTALVLQTQ